MLFFKNIGFWRCFAFIHKSSIISYSIETSDTTQNFNQKMYVCGLTEWRGIFPKAVQLKSHSLYNISTHYRLSTTWTHPRICQKKLLNFRYSDRHIVNISSLAAYHLISSNIVLTYSVVKFYGYDKSMVFILQSILLQPENHVFWVKIFQRCVKLLLLSKK